MHIHFYLKLTRTGSSYLYCRITQHKLVTEFSTGVKARKITNELHNYCESIRSKLMEIQQRLIVQNNNTPHELKRVYLGSVNTKTLNQVFEEYLKRVKELNDIKASTFKKYKTTYGHSLIFFKDLPITQISTTSIAQFDDYLKESCSVNVRAKHLIHIRLVIRFAQMNGHLDKDPFDGHKFKREKVTKRALSEKQVQQLRSKKLNEVLSKVRDVFVFQCYTGLAYADVFALNKNNIEDEFMTIVRTKTDEVSIIPLLDVTKDILIKYDYKLPVISNQNMNAYLKHIGVMCDIPIVLTTHVARHTCASIFINHGISIYTLAKILGHASIRTTQGYAHLGTATIIDEVKRINKKVK